MQQSCVVTVKSNGDAFRSKANSSSVVFGGLTIQENDVSSTDQGVTVYKQRYQPSIIKTTLVHVAKTDVIAIVAMFDVTITFELDTGDTFTMANAVAIQPGPLQDGEVEITFMGDAVSA
jgi:Phage tail tube protein